MLHDPVRDLRNKCEILEEENRLLRDRIAHLTGQDRAKAARKVFGFTECEAAIFMTLLSRGAAEQGHLQDAIYSDGNLEEPGDPLLAMRSHIKRLRKKAKRLGVEFSTIYGFGYEIEADARALARRLIDGVQA